MIEQSPTGPVHAIHTSERKSFRGCRRRWNWIFREYYYPFIRQKPLEFGIAYHKGMEAWYNPTTWDIDREVVRELAVRAFINECNEQKVYFLQNADQLYLADDIEEDFEERVKLGTEMLRYYCNEVSPREDKGFKPVLVEAQFMVPIVDPEGRQLICPCHNLPVVLAGRYDMLAEDDFGDYWIYDWKTALSLREDTHEYLQVDDQISPYVWAASRVLHLPVRGFIYHEQRKDIPRPPKQNKFCREGRWYSIAQNQSTDYDTYKPYVEEHDPVAFREGLYDDFLTFLQNDGIKFFARYQEHKSETQLDSIGRNLWLEALDILDPGIRLYPNPGRFACNSCAFKGPCIGIDSGEDYRYTLDTMYERRENIYIRPKPSTESKGAE